MNIIYSIITFKMSGIINKGTGAGGANTNINGKGFEQNTENEERLISQKGFIRKNIPNKNGKYNYYLEHTLFGSLYPGT